MKEAKAGNGEKRGLIASGVEAHKEYSKVIYEQEVTSPMYLIYVGTAGLAMQQKGFEIAVEVSSDKKHGVHKFIVRAKEKDRKDLTAQGALILGLVEAIRYKVEEGGLVSKSGGRDISPAAQEISNKLLGELVDNSKMYAAFKEYYGGLRWSSDQEKLVRDMFRHGTDYDEALVRKNLSGSLLNRLIYALDEHLPYEKTRNWHKLDPGTIFKEYPDLDYMRLRNSEFAASAEGRRLQQAYAQLLGEMVGDSFFRAEKEITPDGKILPKPLITLSRYPIIEALMCDEVSLDRPKPKYSMGPREVVDLIVNSDSVLAHRALVRGFNTRLPEEQRFVFDGPNEFQHKRGNVWSILNAYSEYLENPESRKLLDEDLLAILEAYTDKGQIAVSVRAEHERREGSDIYVVKEIVGDILTKVLCSPNRTLAAKAEDIIRNNCSVIRAKISDPLVFDRGELMLMIFDTLKEVSAESRVTILGSLATYLFGNSSEGLRLVEFARVEQRILGLRNQPQIIKALAELRQQGIAIKDNSPEQEMAQKNYDRLTKPANEASKHLEDAKNELLIRTIKRLAKGEIDNLSERSGSNLFGELVKRVDIHGYHMSKLCKEYYTLVEIAYSPGVNDKNKSNIVWHFAKQLST